MAEKKQYATIDDYIKDFDEPTRGKLIELKAYILEAAPGSAELFNYDIPAFALVEGGKREQQIMMAGYKKHVGLYPHPTVMEHFDTELSDYKRSKGSVQFPVNKELPKELILRMVKYRMNLVKSN